MSHSSRWTSRTAAEGAPGRPCTEHRRSAASASRARRAPPSACAVTEQAENETRRGRQGSRDRGRHSLRETRRPGPRRRRSRAPREVRPQGPTGDEGRRERPIVGRIRVAGLAVGQISRDRRRTVPGGCPRDDGIHRDRPSVRDQPLHEGEPSHSEVVAGATGGPGAERGRRAGRNDRAGGYLGRPAAAFGPHLLGLIGTGPGQGSGEHSPQCPETRAQLPGRER